MASETHGGLTTVRRLLQKNERFEEKYGMNFRDFTKALDRARTIEDEHEQDWREWDLVISELQPEQTNT